ncbi:MAG: hypothetical protein IBJ00_01990 [Alphaproteobacteria bacterium]|nr:hypothetical protein [Alphaproteobacteria bacterium]
MSSLTPYYHSLVKCPEKTKNLVVEPHDVCLWKSVQKKSNQEESQSEKYEGVQRTTRKPFFSTFNSGSITFTMRLNGVIEVESELKGVESLTSWKSEDNDLEDKVTPLVLDKEKMEAFVHEEDSDDEGSELSNLEDFSFLKGRFFKKNSDSPYLLSGSQPIEKESKGEDEEEEKSEDTAQSLSQRRRKDLPHMKILERKESPTVMDPIGVAQSRSVTDSSQDTKKRKKGKQVKPSEKLSSLQVKEASSVKAEGRGMTKIEEGPKKQKQKQVKEPKKTQIFKKESRKGQGKKKGK